MGLGNILLGDDGVGVYAVRSLRQEHPHPRVSYYDGGTGGLSLLPWMEEGSHLLLLDSIKGTGRPGSIVEIPEESLFTPIPLKLSVHDVALVDLLALLRLRKGESLETMRVLGMIPSSLKLSADLSSEVETSLPQLIQRAAHIVEGWLSPN